MASTINENWLVTFPWLSQTNMLNTRRICQIRTEGTQKWQSGHNPFAPTTKSDLSTSFELEDWMEAQQAEGKPVSVDKKSHLGKWLKYSKGKWELKELLVKTSNSNIAQTFLYIENYPVNYSVDESKEKLVILRHILVI